MDESSYPIYKPDLCGKQPVVGFLLERKTFPASKGGIPWDAFIIELTHPTLAVERVSNEVITVPAGSKICIPAYAKLDLAKLAADPYLVSEIAIQPGDPIDIGNGCRILNFRQKILSVKSRDGAAAYKAELIVELRATNGVLQVANDVLKKRNSELEIAYDKHLKVEESSNELIEDLQADKRELEDSLLFFVMKAHRRRMKKMNKINNERSDEE